MDGGTATGSTLWLRTLLLLLIVVSATNGVLFIIPVSYGTDEFPSILNYVVGGATVATFGITLVGGGATLVVLKKQRRRSR